MSSSSVVLNGAVNLLSTRQGLANAGKLFAVTNPTPGTAIAYANQTSFSATANGLFTVSNSNPSGGPNIILDRLVLKQTATAPTGTLTLRMETYLEQAIVALSGTAAARTPVNLNAGVTNAPGATVTSFAAGAATVPAAVGTRRLTNVGGLVTGVTVIHDEFAFDFSGDFIGHKNGGAAARATDAARIVSGLAPVIIAPSTSAIVNLWWVTSAANVPSFEFELTYIEI
jgi:hypothetical protein